MTDSTDKNSKEKLDQSSRRESLHSRLNSIDKKSQRDNSNVDLDAMLDEAESSLHPVHESLDDEDAIDRLLMNAGFDNDDALMPAATNSARNTAKDDNGPHDELDDFLNFDDFDDDVNQPVQTQATVAEFNQAVQNLSGSAPEDEDDLDRLLMAGFGTDDTSAQELEELDDFSDFKNSDAPKRVAQDFAPTAKVEEIDEFFGLNDEFDGSDPIQDDEIETLTPAVKGSTAIDAGAVKPSTEKAEDFNFDSFGDDFDVADLIQDDEAEAELAPADKPKQPVEPPPIADLSDEVDELSGFGDDFDVSDLIQDDEAEVDLAPPDKPKQPVEPSPIADLSDEVDEFSGFGDDFDVSDLIQDDEAEAEADLAPADKPKQPVEPSPIADLSGDVDEFSGFVDDFDALDLIQDDEAEVVADLAPSNQPQPPVEPPSTVNLSNPVDDFSGFGDDFDVSDLIQDDDAEAAATVAAPDEPKPPVELPAIADLSGETDDFSGFGDDFDMSDLIQDDDAEVAATVAPPDESKPPVELSAAADLSDEADDFSGFGDDFDVSDLIQDDDSDENNIDRLLMETEPDTEDARKKTDEFDDADLDDFFQLDEVSDDFSKENEDAQPDNTQEASAPDELEDDFLLPDFDITADTEISDEMDFSDMGNNAGIEDEFANDFLNEDNVEQTIEPEMAKLKPEDSEAKAKDEDKLKLSPFGFEQEDFKKQLDEAEKKVKKARLLSYIALGFGVVAASAAVGLGIMTYGAKNEISKQAVVASTPEANQAKDTTANPHDDINSVKNSIVQLNQQLAGFIKELQDVSKALDSVQAKMGGEEKLASAQPVAEPAKAEAAHEHAPNKEVSEQESAAAKDIAAHEIPPVKEASAHEIASAKETVMRKTALAKEVSAHDIASAKSGAGASHEIASVKGGAAHEAAPVKEGTAHETAPTKERALLEAAPAKVEVVHEATPAKVEAAYKAPAAKVKVQAEPVRAKPVAAAKAVVKEEPALIEGQTPPGKWGVNLVAVKQEWYANSKAAEFARRGIIAEIVPIQGNNSTMYRLRVKGFRTKAEANANTARIKQALNLDSVWVSDD
ncbi:MAG: SPOR domain-containing protein [Methylobacter sp.]|nr:SPOR domain-containing protein [Methylobacter sp.]